MRRVQLSVSTLVKMMPLMAVILIAATVFLLKPDGTGPDVTNYLNTARRMLQGESYIPAPESADYGKSSVRSPLYSILFAIAFRFLGVSLASAFLIPQLTLFGSILVIFLILRRSFDLKSGLAAVALVGFSYFMMTFPVTFNIDQAMAFFLLLGILITVIALEKNNPRLGILAGALMGIAVLVKELSLLWLPIIIYLYLTVPAWRNQENFYVVLGYIVGGMIAAGSWWLYYYLQTGMIFLLDRIPPRALQIVQFISVFAVLSFLIIALLFRNRQRYTSSPWFLKLQVLISHYSSAFGWFLWFVITIAFSIALSWRTSFRFDSHPEILLRLTNFVEYYRIYIVPAHPLFQYLPFASLIVIANGILKKQRGNQILLWIFLGGLPLILTAYMPDVNAMPIRYFFPLYWLAYMVLGRGLVITLEAANAVLTFIVSNITAGKLRDLPLSNLAFVLLLGSSFGTSFNTTKNYEYYIRSTDNYTNIHVQEVSEWLLKNVEPGSNIVVENAFNTGYRLFTKGVFDFFRWDSLNESLEGTKWAVETQVSLERKSDRLELLSKRGNGYSLPVPNPMYMEYGWDYKELSEEDGMEETNSSIQVESVPRFFTITEENLIDHLNRYQIDYIILPESSFPHHRFYERIPSYFDDSPAFEHAYVSQWIDRDYSYTIHVYKVNRDLLEFTNYPTSISADTWDYLENRARTLMGDQYDVAALVEAIGGGPVVMSIPSNFNFNIYQKIADAYYKDNKVDLAAFELHLALQEAPDKADKLVEVAEQLSDNYPEVAGSWLLLGDVHYHQGDLTRAEEAYARAISAPSGNDHTFGAAYQMLGKLYLANDRFSETNDILHAALEQSIFGGEFVQKGLTLVQANLQLAQGNWDQAVTLFNEYFSEDLAPQSTWTYSADRITYLDLLKQYIDMQVEGSTTRPTVFFVDGKVYPTLYAHPSSNITYRMEVPPNSELNFAPLLDPSVWQYGKGDGVQFTIHLQTEDDRRYRLYDAYLDPKNLVSHRSVVTETVDLSYWAGQAVTITLSTGCGPNDDCDYDWAGWGEPRITQPVSYAFLDHFSEARGETLDTETGHAEVITQTINYDARPILFQHPSSQVTYSMELPEQASLQFGLGMSPEVWTAERSDGAEYNLYVRTAEEPEVLHQVYQRRIDPKNNPDDRRWFDERIDLSKYGGQQVEIIFEALPGPANNFDFDWGGWSSPVLIDETIPNSKGEQAIGSGRQDP